METYPISLGDEVKKPIRIGINHTVANYNDNSIISSFNGYFNDEEVALYSGKYTIYCKLGDIKEAYQLLRANIVSKSPYTIEERSDCVYRAIISFFGYNTKGDNVLNSFPSGKENKEVADLAHKNVAPSYARAMVAQNLLIESEIKSVFKESEVMIDGVCMHHAYNLISEDGRYYIFDTTLPSVNDAKITPIICEIPKEVYDLISRPEADIGYSVNVTHFDPFQQKDINIVYDPERPFIYKVGETIQKVIK